MTNIYGNDAVYISVMLDANNGTPSGDSVSGWANRLGMNHPVLADSNSETGPFVTQGFPTYPVINPDMVIINVDLYPFNPNTLGQYIANGN